MLWSVVFHQSPAWLPLAIILCAFGTVLDAYDLSQRRQPQGPLGVALDYSLATTFPVGLDANPQPRRNWMFSSHLKFNQHVSTISDSQLWRIAFDAFAEVLPEMRQYGINPNHNQPGAMTVLAFGNELILASSQKGPVSFSYTFRDSPVLETLRLCQAIYRESSVTGSDKEHRTAGRCGEIMAAHLYYVQHPDTRLSDTQARIATVTIRNRQEAPAATDPCGDAQHASTHRLHLKSEGVMLTILIGQLGLPAICDT